MNCILILSHGNADPERGFSGNKHGSTTSEETIGALKFVKDFLNMKDRVESVKVSKGLIRLCQNAHSLYTHQLAEKRKQELEF